MGEKRTPHICRARVKRKIPIILDTGKFLCHRLAAQLGEQSGVCTLTLF
jgi:hypothetical protein